MEMHVIPNDEQVEELDCCKYLWSQAANDGHCERDVVHRMNVGYRAWGALKSMMSNRGLGIKAKKCLYFLDTWSGFETAKTAPWPSRGLHHFGKFLEPSDK